MNRLQFTKNIVGLLGEMIAASEPVIGDFWKRTTEEQKRMFDAGLSKCDGVKKVSAHQTAKAMDLYFIVDGQIDNTPDRYIKWHKRWEEIGGKPMIEWDKCHFE